MWQGINKITFVYIGRAKTAAGLRLSAGSAKLVYLTFWLNLFLWLRERSTLALFLCKSADLYFTRLRADWLI